MCTKKYILQTILLQLGILVFFLSCTDDLDTRPLDPDEQVVDVVYGQDLAAYKSGLAKIYAGYAVSGNQGGDAESDVSGVDASSQASFLRGLWNLQTLPTDEALCSWTDVGIDEFNYMSWNSTNVFIKGMYYRLFYQVNLVNEFLRETTDSKLEGRGVDKETHKEIKVYRADARFMRALAYYYLLDMYRNVPFINEDSKIGKDTPEQIMAPELFTYIESELIACQEDLLEPFVGFHSKYYGRVTKAAAWTLLSRLYLNAEVYTGIKKYNEAVTYSDKVFSVGYEFHPKYEDVFKADNHNTKEIIFPIRYDGPDTQTWGGMTFLICSTIPSAIRADMNAQAAWQGNRARIALKHTFSKESNHYADTRFKMLRSDLTVEEEISTPTNFKEGIPVVKYVNINSDGSFPSDNMAYTDFPLFRLSEVNLNYAEAVLRGGNGDKTKALKLVNDIRKRAYGEQNGAIIADTDLTLDFILDERGREFFFEAQRRTDLVRFGKLTSDAYIWTWKGGVATGKAVDKKFNIYPIPADDMGSNPNLVQNEGYSTTTQK